MPNERPDFPYESFATDDPEHRAALDAFHREYGNPTPNRAELDEHAERVRAAPGLVGDFERWWLSPRVQAFISELNATGI
ncbi:MAG: hypothetical protein M3R44_06340 [Candidatus Eremiobacteraeota bacterium]|nr:hypothetical protein [Candidatus Eremiobacteraeota bacterium]